MSIDHRPFSALIRAELEHSTFADRVLAAIWRTMHLQKVCDLIGRNAFGLFATALRSHIQRAWKKRTPRGSSTWSHREAIAKTSVYSQCWNMAAHTNSGNRRFKCTVATGMTRIDTGNIYVAIIIWEWQTNWPGRKLRNVLDSELVTPVVQ